MKCAVLLIFLWPAFALPASAQSDPLAPPGGARADSMPEVAVSDKNAAPLFAVLTTLRAAEPTGALAAWDPAPPSEPPTGLPDVLSVFPSYTVQVYGGYTYVRFREGGGFSPDLNGFDAGTIYYPRGRWIGADGEFILGFGTQNKTQAAKLLLGMGGPAFRRAGPRQSQMWVHALFGGSHFLPQTTSGGQSAFGYEVGGGFDVKAWNPHFAYRLQADLVGTRYFSKSQFSPKVSIGLVWML
jgi:hypothetical protein